MEWSCLGGTLKRILPVFAVMLAACTQEIPAGFPSDLPTIVYPAAETAAETAEFLILPTPEPTSTPYVTFPPASSIPEVSISMVAIGDSLTFGEGDDTFRGYPGRLLELVNQVRPDSSMLNLGQPGWDSDALIRGNGGSPGQLGLAITEVRTALAQERGAVVLIWIGSNDLWYLYAAGGDVGKEREEQDIRNFSNNLNTILLELRSAGAEVIIAVLDDQSRSPLKTQGDSLAGILPNEMGGMSLQVQRYNHVILEKAEQYGALTVDLHSTEIFSNPAYLSEDGFHPNRRGYDLIAQEWYKVLSLLFD
jgi:lysophospholipase L1-like esterase